MIKVNGSAVVNAIKTKWPKLEVQFEEEQSEQVFVIKLGDDYHTIFISLCEVEQLKSKKDVFLFISTGNDEIKDTTVYKKYFNIDQSKTDEDNIIDFLTESLYTYAHREYRDMKPILDDLDRMNVPDMCEGEHSFQIIERVTGITYF